MGSEKLLILLRSGNDCSSWLLSVMCFLCVCVCVSLGIHMNLRVTVNVCMKCVGPYRDSMVLDDWDCCWSGGKDNCFKHWNQLATERHMGYQGRFLQRSEQPHSLLTISFLSNSFTHFATILVTFQKATKPQMRQLFKISHTKGLMIALESFSSSKQLSHILISTRSFCGSLSGL